MNDLVGVVVLVAICITAMLVLYHAVYKHLER